MSTRDEATRVIRTQTIVTDLATSKDIARRLEYAGLLAPDLPEPGVFKDGAEVEWATLDGYVNVENGLITVSHDERAEGDTPEKNALLWPEPGQIKFLNPAAAEYLGHLLLAAAKQAEEGNQRE